MSRHPIEVTLGGSHSCFPAPCCCGPEVHKWASRHASGQLALRAPDAFLFVAAGAPRHTTRMVRLPELPHRQSTTVGGSESVANELPRHLSLNG
ncbi:hypothetical protein BR93DRAFT_327291 [Coniochaeta sp. PMI_546]|nr:hypothetical protein BR93DRAFT_327291 [Coniochaeta sp. PMI_546]